LTIVPLVEEEEEVFFFFPNKTRSEFSLLLKKSVALSVTGMLIR
jgi:hypothetical protein